MKKGYNLLALKALDYFFENPYSEIYLREFSRKLSISANSANRFLNMFLEEGLITEKRIANLRYFSANMNSLTFRQMKIVKNVRELELSGLINELRGKCLTCVLFGSSSKGEDETNSDFDFVVISKDTQSIKKIFNKFQKKFIRELSWHIMSKSEWKKQYSENQAFYQDVVSSGINLIGTIPIM